MIYNGQVFSDDYDILQGAEVMEISSGRKSVTNSEGRFSLEVAGMNSPLKIIMFGYKEQVVTPTQLETENGVAFLVPAINLVQQSAPKKSDNTLLWVMAAVAATFAVVKYAGNKPKNVKV